MFVYNIFINHANASYSQSHPAKIIQKISTIYHIFIIIDVHIDYIDMLQDQAPRRMIANIMHYLFT